MDRRRERESQIRGEHSCVAAAAAEAVGERAQVSLSLALFCLKRLSSPSIERERTREKQEREREGSDSLHGSQDLTLSLVATHSLASDAATHADTLLSLSLSHTLSLDHTVLCLSFLLLFFCFSLPHYFPASSRAREEQISSAHADRRLKERTKKQRSQNAGPATAVLPVSPSKEAHSPLTSILISH